MPKKTPKQDSVKNASPSQASLKNLVIAEKPSVAKDLVNALPGKFKASKTHFESDDYIVSFAVGHLVTICTPPEIDERLKSWSLDHLPIIPEKFPLKALPRTKTQLNALVKLIKRRDVGTIINACDAGREGELIFRYILQYAGEKALAKKKLRRLWLQSMTSSAIKEGFQRLRENEEMTGLAAAAKCRSESDWLIGINGSRALTGYKSRFGGFRLTPCGRVQTPTLSIIIQREEEIKSFVSQKYWEVEARFEHSAGEYLGKWFLPDFKKQPEKPHARADRIWSRDEADAVIKTCQGKAATVEETQKATTQSSPPLYDLTSLQREANSRFGFSAKRTLDIMQALYDRHKVVTYPRTDSRHLPENYLKHTADVMGSLRYMGLEKHAKKVLNQKWIRPNKRIFNDQKISDHHAIIPTTVTPSGLSDVEAKIYGMVSQRFVAIFFPPAEYLNTTRISTIGEHSFRTDGKILKVPGWRDVYGIEAAAQDEIAAVPKGEKPVAEALERRDLETQPPPRYNESTLLSVMESAGKLVEDEELQEAMKERGLGTAATRAAIIEGLIHDKYLVRQGKDLVPTAKAAELLETLSKMKIEELSSPELTGEWEYRLEQISRGKNSRDAFMREIANLTRAIVSKVKSFDEEAAANKQEAFFDKSTGQKFFETLSYFESEDGSIRIRKFMGGRQFGKEEIEELLRERKLGPITDFVSKAGKSFSAVIKLKDDNKVEFVFSEEQNEKPDFSQLEVVGTSPVDGSKVYAADVAYVSESFFDRESKSGLKINKVLLGKEIPKENIVQMLNGEKTDLIKGFRSSKTKRLFDAYLALGKNGKIQFSFPPRKSFRKKAAAKSDG